MADQFHVGGPRSLFPKRVINSNLGGQGIHYDCSSSGGENVESRNSSTPVCLVPALLLHPVLSLTFPAQEFWVQCISVYLLQKKHSWMSADLSLCRAKSLHFLCSTFSSYFVFVCVIIQCGQTLS